MITNRKILINRLILLISVVILFSFLFAPQQSLIKSALGAESDQNVIFGAFEYVSSKSGLSTGEQAATPEQVVGSIIGGVLAFIGVFFLILVIYGAITWMTAGGSEERIKKAKGIIVNAVIGIAVVFAAYAITYFITQQLGQATGV